MIERLTGRQFAAKFTKVRDEADKDFFRLELEALLRQKSPHVEKLYDAYESPHQLILVVDLYPFDSLPFDQVILVPLEAGDSRLLSVTTTRENGIL